MEEGGLWERTEEKRPQLGYKETRFVKYLMLWQLNDVFGYPDHPVIVHFCSLHVTLRGEERVLAWVGLVEGHGQVA